jgi:hypothetical protein
MALVRELFDETSVEDRCSYVRLDSEGPYCSKDLVVGTPINLGRRLVCSADSLQLWCLDKERVLKCAYYHGMPL